MKKQKKKIQAIQPKWFQHFLKLHLFIFSKNIYSIIWTIKPVVPSYLRPYSRGRSFLCSCPCHWYHQRIDFHQKGKCIYPAVEEKLTKTVLWSHRRWSSSTPSQLLSIPIRLFHHRSWPFALASNNQRNTDETEREFVMLPRHEQIRLDCIVVLDAELRESLPAVFLDRTSRKEG